MSTRSLTGPIIAIVVGVLIVLVHLSLAATGVMAAAQWVSGVVIGLLIAGVGNHRRIFGRR